MRRRRFHDPYPHRPAVLALAHHAHLDRKPRRPPAARPRLCARRVHRIANHSTPAGASTRSTAPTRSFFRGRVVADIGADAEVEAAAQRRRGTNPFARAPARSRSPPRCGERSRAAPDSGHWRRRSRRAAPRPAREARGRNRARACVRPDRAPAAVASRRASASAPGHRCIQYGGSGASSSRSRAAPSTNSSRWMARQSRTPTSSIESSTTWQGTVMTEN